MKKLNGIIPVLVTPLDKKGNIDTHGLKKLVNYLLTFDIGGLWVLGTGSEDMNLTYAKRLEVAETVTTTVASRVPLLLGASFFALDDTLNFINDTKHLGVDAYHYMPYHPLLGTDRLEWTYKHIADVCHRPLWLYTSGNWSQQLSFDCVQRLKQHPNIHGIKYSTKDSVNIFQMTELEDADFQVMTAVISNLYQCLCAGVTAHTSSLGSAFPAELVHIFSLFTQGRLDEAKHAQRAFNAFLADIPKSTKKSNFLGAAEEKYVLSLRGICDAYTTSYYRDVTAEEGGLIKASLEKHEIEI